MLPPVLQEQLVARTAGRAVAHELGHYLLGTGEHADRGLMRAGFTHVDLLDASLERFRLTPDEATRLTERLLVQRQAILVARQPDGGR